MIDRNKIIQEIIQDYYMNQRGIITKEDLLKIIYYICIRYRKNVWYKDDLIIKIYNFLKRSNPNYIPLTLRSIEYKLYKLAKEKRYIKLTPSWLYKNPFFPKTKRYIINVMVQLIEREILK